MSRRLTIKEKKRILDMLDEAGATQSSVAKRMGVSRKSVYNAVANRDAINESVNLSGSRIRCCVKVSETYRKLNVALSGWFLAMREKHGEIPLVERVICEKAVKLARQLGLDNFKASKGWYRSWSERYGVRSYKVSEQF